MDYDMDSDLVMSSHIDEQLLDRSFKSRDAAFEALQEWAKGQGFAVKVKQCHFYNKHSISITVMSIYHFYNMTPCAHRKDRPTRRGKTPQCLAHETKFKYTLSLLHGLVC